MAKKIHKRDRLPACAVFKRNPQVCGLAETDGAVDDVFKCPARGSSALFNAQAPQSRAKEPKSYKIVFNASITASFD
jgi:hypothetical protein